MLVDFCNAYGISSYMCLQNSQKLHAFACSMLIHHASLETSFSQEYFDVETTVSQREFTH